MRTGTLIRCPSVTYWTIKSSEGVTRGHEGDQKENKSSNEETLELLLPIGGTWSTR